ncbi:ATP synthase subunit O, mitochondrial [Ambystoma mexicanum]|uniref:ATP synthase peripheral stalk subunit OSCP, mitochondrial n=1 Tax=Ailuropoda melanoleuca TaxID=9646 RepID=A0A7N5JYG7_AILME|nr:ATP synthase subunit O, mitochondrial-like [Ailuropoda melanoleuca]
MAAVAGLRVQVRNFSTGTAMQVAKLIRPPIPVFGLEGRYATALYSAASKQQKLEQVEKELTRVSALVKESKTFALITNPHVKRALKQKTLNDILTKEKLTPITVNFVCLLAENGRLKSVGGIINSFSKIMSAHRGEVTCAVTTAKPLDEPTLADLKTALNAFLAKGEVLQLETKTDPAILGGMVITIGDKFIDMSTKAKIQKLTKIMRAP